MRTDSNKLSSMAHERNRAAVGLDLAFATTPSTGCQMLDSWKLPATEKIT